MSWPVVELGDVVTIKGGGTPNKNIEAYWGGNIPWASVKDFKHRNIKITEDFITGEGVRNSSTNVIPAETIIIPTRMALGKVAITGCDMAINQDIKALFINDRDILDRDFLARLLESKASYIESEGKGATVKGITLDVLKKIKIPLPPLEEQKRIAAILDKADAIRQKRQKAIDLADEFLRSVFLDMFGDPVTNPKEWEIFKFEDVGALDRGKSKHRPRNDPKLLNGKYPLIQTGDIANSGGYITKFTSTYSEFGLAQSKIWSIGTLCITIAANIAKTGILTFDACFPDSIVGFIANKKVTAEYVQHWLSFLQKTLEESAPESAQKNINLAILRELNIPVPPLRNQQNFSKIVNHIREIKKQANKTNEIHMDVFNAISYKAFSGEL